MKKSNTSSIQFTHVIRNIIISFVQIITVVAISKYYIDRTGFEFRVLGLVRTVNTNSRVWAFIVGVVVGGNVAGRDAISFARDRKVTIAGNIDTFVGVHWVIVYGLE